MSVAGSSIFNFSEHPSAGAPDPGGELLLSDLLTRSVSIEWYEAVALVRAVAERVRDRVGGHGVPELHQVQVLPDGAVSLLGTTPVDEPVRRLGQLLLACLTHADPPVQLRLAASLATAASPGFGSIREFSEALAYYERPDRPHVLRGLYERASGAPASPGAVVPRLDDVAPLASTGPARARRRRLKPTLIKMAKVALPAALVVTAGVMLYGRYGGATPSSDQVSAVAVAASDVLGGALVSGISTVSEAAGLGRFVPESAVAAPVAVTPPRAATPVRRRRAPVRPPQVFDLQTVGTPVESEPLAIEPVPSLPPTVPEGPAADLVADEAVYTSADTDIVAPIGVRPQLPRQLPPDVRREDLTQMELIILKDGTVGSARLISAPTNVMHGMLLSAAKAWKFAPATRDGRPVTYRKIVWLALQ